MKIINLEIENIKHLKVVNVEPDGSIVIIGGDNAQGKSCVLDSIEYALSGQTSIPEMPIRKGQKKARVVVDLGDIEVIRTFTASGSRLVVKGKDGKPQPSPQTLLDKLVGNLTFDPLHFARMDPKTRLATLKKVVGLDFAEQDQEYSAVFTKRTDVNKEGKALKTRLDGMECFDDVPDKEISVSELSNQYADAIRQNTNHKVDLEAIQTSEDQLQRLLIKREELDAQIAEVRDQIANRKDLAQTFGPINTDALKQRIDQADAINSKVRIMKERTMIESQLSPLRRESQGLTRKLQEIEEYKAKALEEADFPVDGLAFDDDGVTIDGIPFDQCSTSQQIRTSVAMGLAMNPELRILLIREGSLLDKKNLAMVAEMAEDFEAQVWIERVSQGDECQVIIEDGSVVEKQLCQ